MLTFKKKYFILTILLFLTEIFIALYVKDSIIRPFGGDFLVVILIYCFLKTFWKQSAEIIAVAVLIFSYGIEIAQYFKIVELLHLQGNKLARIIIGTSFHWLDLLAYTLGVMTAYFFDKKTSIFDN